MNNSTEFKTPIILAFFIGLIWANLSWAEVSHSEIELQEFIKVYEDRSASVSKVVIGKLEFSGITDARLYDVIEKRLLDEYRSGDADDVSWLAKTLAYSGEEKYKKTLTQVLNTVKKSKVEMHVRKALKRLPLYRVWNVDLKKDTEGLSGDALFRKRTINMVNSSNSHLTMLGAKRIWFHHPTDKLFVAAAKNKLMADLNVSNPSRRDVDALGWLCKVLSKSGDSQYLAVLLDISRSASNRRVRSYAKKYARLL